jgi:ribosomal protein S18 acetylase RimI-like enzyme
MRIQPYEEPMREAIVALSLRAWAPVFQSIESGMDPEVYRALHPDWRVTQRSAVEAACADEDVPVWIAVDGGRVAGFVALKLYAADRLGEIYMIAVDPDHQRRGIASALSRHSFEWLSAAGMAVVMVETGGDPGHAPARHAYEAMGFRMFPTAKYFRKL